MSGLIKYYTYFYLIYVCVCVCVCVCVWIHIHIYLSYKCLQNIYKNWKSKFLNSTIYNTFIPVNWHLSCYLLFNCCHKHILYSKLNWRKRSFCLIYTSLSRYLYIHHTLSHIFAFLSLISLSCLVYTWKYNEYRDLFLVYKPV